MLRMVSDNQIRSIGRILSDSNTPMKARYRALFTLRGIGSVTAIRIIAENFTDSSSLLKHEMAYCLGQMQNEYSLDILRDLVQDIQQDIIVRHEAAEALGAIANVKDLPMLEKYSNDPAIELAETCQIAADRIKWMETKSIAEKVEANPFDTIDPAPAMPSDSIWSVDELKAQLMDENLSLFTRYRAMFSLRNLRTEEAVMALAEGFKASSALLRHEIAYVFGQLSHQASEPSLTATLADTAEHGIVRHECAEALGSVATPSSMKTLERYITDNEQIVRESCEVALDMAEYEMSGDFEYANALKTAVGVQTQ